MGHRWGAGSLPFRVTALGVTTPPNSAGSGKNSLNPRMRLISCINHVPAIRKTGPVGRESFVATPLTNALLLRILHFDLRRDLI